MKHSLKNLIDHLAHSDTSPTGTTSCLECGKTLTSRGGQLKVCTGCQGVWVSPKAFESLMQGPRKALDDLLGSTADGGHTHQPSTVARDCPTCGQAMTNYQYQDLWLDACPTGHGVWLDPGELRLLRER